MIYWATAAFLLGAMLLGMACAVVQLRTGTVQALVLFLAGSAALAGLYTRAVVVAVGP